MIYKNIYWFYEKAVPERICDEIIYCFKNKEKLKANIGEKNKKNSKIRKSSVSFDRENLWIDALINPFVKNANKLAGWNFDIECPETHQFTEYKKNQHYNWHTDSFDSPYNIPNDYKHGKIRKLSMSLCLSGENTYEGGELLFSTINLNKKTNILNVKDMNKKGSLIVFPSYTWHKVTPVTKGTRHSLVIWYLGNPYR
jgi:PKHD-type hydroxylase